MFEAIDSMNGAVTSPSNLGYDEVSMQIFMPVFYTLAQRTRDKAARSTESRYFDRLEMYSYIWSRSSFGISPSLKPGIRPLPLRT